MNSRKAWIMSGAAIAALVAWSPAALAQTAPRNAASNQLEEVIVTATKRESNLQQVPVAVAAISGEQLVKQQAVTLRDLQYSIPNLVFAGQSTNRRPDITLRGISSATRAPGFEGSIGFFVDGVYLPFPAQWNNPVLDVDRVEVLYGPQDTLFGKNTISGAISITTKRPTFDFGGSVNLEAGNYNFHMVRGSVNVPIGDRTAVRLTAFGSERDGYIRNVFNGHKYGNSDQAGARLQVRTQPNDKLDINFSASIYDEHGAEVQSQREGGQFSTNDPRKVNLNIDPKTSRQLYDSALQVDLDLDNGSKLTSITAYGALRAWYRMDEDANPVDLWFTNIADHSDEFSQELRYTSPTGGLVDYVAGLYYQHTFWAQSGTLEILPGDPNSDPGGVGTLRNANASPRDYGVANSRRVSGNSYAGFADLRVHPAERWTVHGGLRLAYDTKDLNYPGQITFGAGFLNLCKLGRASGGACLIPGGAYPNIPAFSDYLKKGALTGSFGVDFQATPDAMLYAKVSTGQKGGGWNTGTQRSTQPPRFGPEKVTAYEAGLKSEWFDRRLRLNADVFYEDYRNKQETIFISITEGFRIDNAASATIKGAEATANLKLGEFRFDGGVGYVDATYDDFACTATLNCKGQQLVFVPKLTANAAVEWDHTLEGVGDLTLRLEGTRRSKLFLGVPNADPTSVPGVTLFNARASLKLADGVTDFYVFGKNIADKTYIISQVPGDPSSPSRGATFSRLYGQPRMFGVGVRREF